MISKPRTLPHLLAVVSILLSTFLSPFALVPVQAAPEAPLDTPVPVVNDQFSDWTVNDGMAYWAENCVIIPRQSAATVVQAYLRRKPTNGTVTKTLSEQSDCVSKYQNMTADNTGLYYYDQTELGLFFRPSGSPLDPPTKVFTMTATLAPVYGSRLA